MTALRPAVPWDAAVAASLVDAAYQHYVSRVGRPPAPMEADYEEIARSGHMWMAEDGGEVVGLIVLEDASDHLLLDNVAVSPAAQGSGVGGQLLAFAEEEAVKRGFDRVCLYTNAAMIENLRYYTRKGYTETHRARQSGFQRVFFEKRLRRQSRGGYVLDLLERLRSAAIAQDAERLAGLYAEDAVHEFPFVTPGAPTRLEGRAAIAEFNATVFSKLPFRYREYRTVAVHHTETAVLVVEQEALGTNTATGAQFALPNVWVIEVDSQGLIVKLRDYVNPVAVASALGDISLG